MAYHDQHYKLTTQEMCEDNPATMYFLDSRACKVRFCFPGLD